MLLAMTGARNRAHWGGNALFIRPNVRCRKRPMAKKGQKIKGRPEGSLVAIIADEDTVTGFLLAGVGNVDAKRKSNFLIVDNKTPKQAIEDAFRSFTTREDIGVILISQQIADDLRHLLEKYESVVPTILEIPTKNHPYDPSKDFMMTRLKRMMGARD